MTVENVSPTYLTVGLCNSGSDDMFFQAELAKLERYSRAINAKTQAGGRPEIPDDDNIYDITPGVLVRTALALDIREFQAINIPAAFAAVTR